MRRGTPRGHVRRSGSFCSPGETSKRRVRVDWSANGRCVHGGCAGGGTSHETRCRCDESSMVWFRSVRGRRRGTWKTLMAAAWRSEMQKSGGGGVEKRLAKSDGTRGPNGGPGGWVGARSIEELYHMRAGCEADDGRRTLPAVHNWWLAKLVWREDVSIHCNGRIWRYAPTNPRP